MKTCRLTLVIAAVAAFGAGSARADWSPGDPYKWVQLPDLSTTGMDVDATDVAPPGLPGNARVLADDFLCTSPGPLTDIHVWGSWKNDVLPGGGPNPFGGVAFRLSIHADIPAGMLEPSMPGELLWDRMFIAGEYTWRLYADDLSEGWYDPVTQVYLPIGDHACYQYNFVIPEPEAFTQVGTPAVPVVYWLDVDVVVPQAMGPNPQPEFGWKTSANHWNDDAVWTIDGDPTWHELRYPSGHPLAGQSIDQAFVITPEPGAALLLLSGLGALAFRRRR